MTTVGDRIVAYAQAQLGDPYVWGATGPNAFDCSGLVYAAYKAAGLDVQRTTAANLGKQGTAVPVAAAAPGDLVYYDEPGSTDHVGIFIGNGQMIDAPTAGKPVRIDAIGTPTSIRRLADLGGTVTKTKGKLEEDESLLEKLNPVDNVADAIGSLFGSWQTDVMSLGLKILAGGTCAALVIVGAREALAQKGAL